MLRELRNRPGLGDQEKVVASGGNRSLVFQHVANFFTLWAFPSHIKTFLPSLNSAVGIATGYGLDDEGVGVRVQVGAVIFLSPRGPDRLWGPFSLLSSGYPWLFPRG
jgi:hypothetical protein